MANEMNKVPCGGFKVGGGLSVDDGMLKMGNIIAAEVYKEGNHTSIGLLIPYKAIQFDNPIVTQTTRQEDQTLTISVYDVFVGAELPFYQVLLNKDIEIKQALINIDLELARAGLFTAVQVSHIHQESHDSDILRGVTADYFEANKSITYNVMEMDIPDEIEEVLHFGGKGWFLEDEASQPKYIKIKEKNYGK